jgi:4-diphosphocytidyl-2-C-methyl-D-erythritol kinase
MIVFPNAKINLGLRIIEKRQDGYHNLESYMVPVAFYDVLEIVPSENGFSFSSSGIKLDTSSRHNLCVQAYDLIKRNYPIKPVKIYLHKLIPAGSGLGGGSSNATFTLSLLRRIFDLKFCNNELEDLAIMLGSDCPFFVINKPQEINNIGITTRNFLPLPDFNIVIVTPGFNISTAEAYRHVKPSGKSIPNSKDLIGNYDKWPDLLFNDFEDYAFGLFPILADIKSKLYEMGAFYASMSGSGSAIYGLFKQGPANMDMLSGFNHRLTKIIGSV